MVGGSIDDTNMNDSIQDPLVGEVSAVQEQTGGASIDNTKIYPNVNTIGSEVNVLKAQDSAMKSSDVISSEIHSRQNDDSYLGKKSSIDGSQSNSPKPNITIVLVGHTGSGKSATGNTILGKKVFKSVPSASSVTTTCELQTESIADGRTINVIDTQGFGDYFAHPDLHIEELEKCFELAKNEIHAILLVVSVTSRFSREEAAAIYNLQIILGSNVVNYVIVVFTGGDELEDQNKNLNDYLGHDCPDPLKDIIRLCGDRRVLFDNRTKIDRKKHEQVQELLSYVQKITSHNGGNPFKHQLYELKKRNQELLNETNKISTLTNANPVACDERMSEKADENSKLSSSFRFSKPNITIVLVGHTGSGKSATGNTILGRRVFKSMPGASRVTITCELQTEILADGQTINVIDTQGFGDYFAHPDLHVEELTKCFELAKNEIHAILLVVSVRSQFSKEEAATIHNLQTLLGSNVVNYVIVVFTGGDELEDQNMSFNDYLGHDCPDPLKDIIRLCGDRCILFDNRTKIEQKKSEQVRELLLLVENVVLHNGGNPFKYQLYELKKRNQELLNEANKISTLTNCEEHMSEKANENSKSQKKRTHRTVEKSQKKDSGNIFRDGVNTVHEYAMNFIPNFSQKKDSDSKLLEKSGVNKTQRK